MAHLVAHSPAKPTVAIVGGGFAGVTLATQLLKLGRRAPHVVLIERSGRFGPGLAYSTSDPRHLLNVRAHAMSADPSKPDEFVDWIRTSRDAPHLVFAPRATYGAYLEAHLRRAMHAAEPGAISLVRDSVLDCRVTGDGAELHVSSGEVIKCAAVVLALGNLASAIPAPFDEADVLNPYNTTALAQIHPSDSVLLLGTGLTMVDVLLSLTAVPRTGRIIGISRRGLTPRPHVDALGQGRAQPPQHIHTLAEAFATLRSNVEAAISADRAWQTEIDGIRPITSEIWRGLSNDEQRRFLRHVRPWWDAHRHRMPPHVATWIGALQRAGVLEITAGRIASARRNGANMQIGFTPRGRTEPERLDIAHVINCTGPRPDVRRSQDPLVESLLARGLARAHPLNLGFDVADDGRLIDAAGERHAHMFALGPLTQGAFWEATAVPEIRMRAAALTAELARLTEQRRNMQRAQSGVVYPRFGRA